MFVWLRPLIQQRAIATTPQRRTAPTAAIPIAKTGKEQRFAPSGINTESIIINS